MVELTEADKDFCYWTADYMVMDSLARMNNETSREDEESAWNALQAIKEYVSTGKLGNWA